MHIIAGSTVLQVNKSAARIHLRPLISGIRTGVRTIFHLPVAAIIEIRGGLPPVDYLVVSSAGGCTRIRVIPRAVEIPAILVPAEIGCLISTVIEDKVGGGDIGKCIRIPAIT